MLKFCSNIFWIKNHLSIVNCPIFSIDVPKNCDHDPRNQIPMDYSDLSLDHSEWKVMLPLDKNRVEWRSASLSFFVDPRTEKNCFMLGAKKLVIREEEGFRCDWQMKSHPKSRFSEVAELVGSWQLDICGRIDTKMLSPETLYAAYLMFALTDMDDQKLESAISVVKSSHGPDYAYLKERAREVQVHFGSANRRADEWMEVQIGDFYVGKGERVMTQVQLLEINGYNKCGPIVEGIEFRPSDAT